MKAKAKLPVKLPRSTVLPPHTFPNPYWKARIICRTRQKAREIVRLHKMSGEGLLQRITHIIYNTPRKSDVPSSVLQALHLIP